MAVPVIALFTVACEEQPPLLTPYSNDVELTVQASDAKPDRVCDLTDKGGNQVEMQIAGDFGQREDPNSLNWQIVAPANWSARNVASQFVVGLGGESSHRWFAEAGEMRADVQWWDERPGDGWDGDIVVTDSAGKTYSGECRSLKPLATDTLS